MPSDVRPIVKWVGGKSRLLPALLPLMPDDVGHYVEPFAGGLAVLFRLALQSAYVSDANPELVNLYEVVRDDVGALVSSLEARAAAHCEAYYYATRALDRDSEAFSRLSAVERASRFVYLNKTAYNGLWRVNSRGEMNAPFGRYANPRIVDEAGLRVVGDFLRDHDVTIACADFADALAHVRGESFVYLDPPYDPTSPTASYVGYAACGFGRVDQERLRDFCDEVDRIGARFVLSNSDTAFVRDLYRAYRVRTVEAPRAISCKGSGRKSVPEVVVSNY